MHIGPTVTGSLIQSGNLPIAPSHTLAIVNIPSHTAWYSFIGSTSLATHQSRG